MVAENSTARPTCIPLIKISRNRSVQVPRVAQTLEKPCPIHRPMLEVSENVLDQDHRGIDDDAKINRAHGEQVGVLSLDDQQDDRKKQRDRNVDPDDDRAAQIAEKNPLDQEHQKAAENQIVQHRVRRHLDERGAVVIGDKFDPRRQRPVVVQSLHHLLDLGDDIVGVLCPPHHDDRGGDVVVVIAPGNA
jgi:hypothetical protein